jgi:hypothetical protein
MKLEFLENGSPDCPLIRLYEFNAKETYDLRCIALHLARGGEQTIALHEQPGVIPIRGCQLTLKQEKKDRGVMETAPLKLAWGLTKSGWFNVAGLIRPFSRGNLSGFQWLSNTCGIKVLLSRDEHW